MNFMQITPPNVLTATTGSIPADATRGTSQFSQLLGAHDAALDQPGRSNQDEVRQAAQSLVAIGFVQPLLAQARQDPFRTDLFHGGFAEDAFGAQLDTILAEQITNRADMPLVESVYRHIAGNGQTSHGTKVNTHG